MSITVLTSLVQLSSLKADQISIIDFHATYAPFSSSRFFNADLLPLSQLVRSLRPFPSARTKLTRRRRCGPCKAIAPVYQQLAQKYAGKVTVRFSPASVSSTPSHSPRPDLEQFFKCDVDKAPEVSQRFGVTAMPTFAVLRGSNKVDEVKGANAPALQALVSRYAPTGSSADAASGAPAEKGLEGFVRRPVFL